MTNMTLALPVELKSEMDRFPEINWSEVARQAFLSKVRDLKLLNKLRAKSNLTEEEAVELGRKVNKSLRKRYGRNV